MKRRGNNAQYNRNLFIILIVAAVIICATVVAAYLLLANDNDKGNQPNVSSASESNMPDSVPDDNPEPPATDDSEDSNSDNSAEIPAVDNSDKEPTDDEQQTDSSDDWMLILANPWNKLPEGFTVELAEIAGGHKVDTRIVDDLNSMMNDLAKEGLSAFVCSSYRTNTKQTTLYNNEVSSYKNLGYSDEEAAIEAAKWVAIPGTSEHQTGLAVDIMSSHYMVLDEGQEDTAEQQWLMENSWKYGFILRYPSDKSEITGIYYEPWHYRYVGKDAAKEIYERGICFEEYLAA